MDITQNKDGARPKIAIIVLNWNGWRDTIECLESVYQIVYQNYVIIVVDNGSEDESLEKIKEYCDGKIEVKSEFFEYNPSNKPIKIIEYERSEAAREGKEDYRCLPFDRSLIIIKNEKNYGFAEGNNIAMRYALKALNPDYLLMLNNDTVVDKNFLENLVNVGESDEKTGIVGPIVYHYRDKKRVQSAGVKLCWNTGTQNVLGSNEIDKKQFGDVVDVDYVSGCALLAKSELIKKLGYLNPEYFAYWEETDWCIRVSKAGYRVLCDSRSKIWHKGSSTSRKVSGFHVYYMTRNMFWFMQQHATRCQYISFLLYFISFRLWFISGIYIYNKDIGSVISFLRGIVIGIKGCAK